MKKYFFLIFVLLFISAPLWAQTKLIIHSKNNIEQLKMKNLTTGEEYAIPTWNKSGGGFLLEVENLEQTAIVSDGMSVFQLFDIDKKQTTQWIGLQENQSMPLQQCFTAYAGEQYEDEGLLSSANNFFASMFSGYSVEESNTLMRGSESLDLRFDENKSNQFVSADDIAIDWQAREGVKIQSISIMDMTEPAIVYIGKNYGKDGLSYSDINDALLQEFQEGHQYQLKIKTTNENTAQAADFDYTFKITPFAFTTPDKMSFIVADSLSIGWKSEMTPETVRIKTEEDGTLLWQSENYDANKLNYSVIANNAEVELPTSKPLLLEVETENGTIYALNFEVLLNNSEYQQFLKFISE